jgi:hypothetical protein
VLSDFLCTRARPLAQGVERHVDVGGTVAAVVSGGRPYEVGERFETKHEIGRLDIDAIDVKVVSALNLGAVELGASDENMDEAIQVGEAGCSDVFE